MTLKAREGYFVRNAEENLVFCPQGKVLSQKSIKKNGDIRLEQSSSYGILFSFERKIEGRVRDRAAIYGL